MSDTPVGSAGSTTMRWASSFFTLCLFLYLGLQLRRIHVFRVFSLPAAVSGGFLGLVFIQLCQINPAVWETVEHDWIVGWSSLPSILINVVFATLFLGKDIPSAKAAWREGGPQIMYGQLIAWGNWVVACFLTGVLLIPVFGVSPLFASMYSVGFEGGHGTAAGLKESYTALGYPHYGDIAVTAATIGILMGCIVGVILVNWGIATNRLHWQKDGTHAAGPSREKVVTAQTEVASKPRGCSKYCSRDTPPDYYPENERPTSGKQTVRQEAVESLALHLIYIAFAIAFGYVILRLLWLIEDAVPALQQVKLFRSFPLFPFCMLGGAIIMWTHSKLGVPAPVDTLVMDRISGAAMEYLILPAIATINVSAVKDDIAPLVIIILGGMTWNFICFFVLAERMLPNFKFERAIVELGQSFGTTATGLLLLRMCDPDRDTTVWKAFSYKQLITEPIMGGGVWTTISLPLLSTIGVWGVFGIASAVVFFWVIMFFVYFRRVYAIDDAEQKKNDDLVEKNKHLELAEVGEHGEKFLEEEAPATVDPKET